MLAANTMAARTGERKGLTCLVVAIAVAHGMCILTLDDRPVLCCIVGKRQALINAGIHGTDHVCGVCARPSTLQVKAHNA